MDIVIRLAEASDSVAIHCIHLQEKVMPYTLLPREVGKNSEKDRLI